MKYSTRSVVMVVVVLVLGVTVYCIVNGVRIGRYYPRIAPTEREDINALSRRVYLARILECTHNGLTYYLAEGEVPPDYVLASGPPVYVFDSRGKLVEWIRDSGDEPSSMSKWNASPSKEISLESALRSIKEHKSP